MEYNKPSVLFVASNIPTPKRKSNKVVMTIAHKLSGRFEVSVLHPAEWVPFPFNLMKKYKNIAGNEPWVDDGIPVRPFKYIRWFGKRNAFRLLPCYQRRIQRYIDQYGTPDWVHAHYALPDGYFAYLIHKSYHVPYVVSFRKSDMVFLDLGKTSSTGKLINEVLSNAKHIIVHNAAQQEVLSRLGFDSLLMAHGIEDSFVQPKTTINHSGNIAIATIGHLVDTKHIDWVIHAVKDYPGNKTVTLKIAGEGPMRKTWEAETAGHDNIAFLGQIDHDRIGEMLQQSDIFALPSVNETFGLVYIEATAHQNAVIATKGTGIWGHFTDGEEMLHCDSYAAFQTMLYKLIDDDGFRNRMAQKAFEKTRDRYTWSAVIDQYASLYR